MEGRWPITVDMDFSSSLIDRKLKVRLTIAATLAFVFLAAG
jgi:hypothetical protein